MASTRTDDLALHTSERDDDEGDVSMPAVIRALLSAIAARDGAQVAELFTEDAAYWTCVPRTPVKGRAAIREMFEKLNRTWSRIEFVIVNWVASGTTVWLERIDRFGAGDHDCEIECAGLVEIDATSGLISEVRDYADMETWRTRTAKSMENA